MIPIVASLAGLVILAVVAVDILTTVLGANGRSSISGLIYRGCWNVLRTLARFLPSPSRQSFLSLGAPLMITALIMLWITAVLLGFAFLFAGGVAGEIDGVVTESRTDLPGALRLSLVALSTIGFVEIGPSDRGYSAMVAVEALAGGFVLTLAASYFIGLQQRILERRTFAVQLWARRKEGARPDPDAVEAALAAMLEGVKTYPVVYYVRPQEFEESLPWVLRRLAGATAPTSTGRRMAPSRRLLRSLAETLDAFPDGPGARPPAPLTPEALQAVHEGLHPGGDPLAERFLEGDDGPEKDLHDRYVEWLDHVGFIEAVSRRVAADLGYEDRWTNRGRPHLLPISDPPRLGPKALVLAGADR
ncbi:hypothetical protein BCF33_2700 [Hasllibacter halocynthiae]|uniref:Ion channel n=1 Tax=Hasllibacter halocynthiae TaxID=595589 RepID=A0A2T0WZB7_9RHOB|nr:hypothetical protein [Hasllibacter halocynthiae]PRY92007.1 hypothetical protein BCF33_2700 [Hasllibacter halocynthiae]